MTSPRAEQLVADAEAELERLLAVTDAHPDASVGEAWKGRRVADVLGHLHDWHVLFCGWVAQARAGATPAYPAEGYTWEQLDELNDHLCASHRDADYATLRGALVTSHAEVLETLRDATEEELTDPAAFPWLGGNALGEVVEHCLAIHYRWALDILERASLR